MVQPDNTPAVTGADVEASVTPAADEPTAPEPAEPEPAEPEPAELEPTAPEPAAPDPDAEIIDAELVPPPIASATSTVPAPAFDYSDAGVPTLGYLQDKIERRYGTALGGTELAGATPEAQSAAKAQEAREKAAADKLEEIRRSLHPDD